MNVDFSEEKEKRLMGKHAKRSGDEERSGILVFETCEGLLSGRKAP